MKNPLKIRRWLVNGVVITLPIVVTLVVLLVVLDFILGILSPIVTAVSYVWADEPSTAFIKSVTVLSLVLIFLVVGIVADITPGRHISKIIDRLIATVPGLGTVYTSIRQAGQMIADDSTEQFKDVKLIEFPHENAYMASFLIGETPSKIEDGLEADEMVTVMVPLGPNPTTNGFVMHMPIENVHDVDLTVEEAIQSIATLGVAEVEGVPSD